MDLNLKFLPLTGLSVWIGLLVLPFVGFRQAALIAAAILFGGLLWSAAIRISRSARRSPRIRMLLDETERFIRTLVARRPAARHPVFLFGIVTGLLIIGPLGMNNYMIDVLTLAGIYIVLALGLNIVVGMAGLLDLGYISFYAIGAYSYALLSTRLGISFWAALPLGGLAAAAFGVVLGVITLRLRGDYLAIVTLGFIQIVHLVLNNWDRVTNGPNGILNIGRPAIGPFVFSQPIHFYYLILAIVSLTILAVNRLSRSRIGRAWIAIREDEVAAQAMGVDTTRLKILAFALGAFWAGIAGVFFAGKFAFVSPESFTFFESVIVLSMVVLGGMGSIPGVVLGALIVVILPEVLREFAGYRMLVFGAALVLMMVFRPQGLIGNPRWRIELRPPGEDLKTQGRSSVNGGADV
ncbi:MAG: branched-chain amino acid ABC transporter permease [Nitrospirae bacterium]|nr:branched-chain amino acid ABC transporter permease [Nitrospirota bacterium]